MQICFINFVQYISGKYFDVTYKCNFLNPGAEELPLPPPPLDLTAPTIFGTGDYVQCNVNTSFPPPPEDLPPPPSPVSSSYSELRRATDTGYPIGQDYQPYTMGSQVKLILFFYSFFLYIFSFRRHLLMNPSTSR